MEKNFGYALGAGVLLSLLFLFIHFRRRRAARETSGFLAMISHEIRTPMSGIMGMVRLLQETSLDARQKEYATAIQHEGEKLLALLNDILDFSRIEAGRMEIESIGFDLGHLLESIVLLMSGRAHEKNITLTADIAPGTPLLVKGDPTRLRQVLLNLVGNAIKFTDKGSVTLSVGPQKETPELLFTVRDTGIGIPGTAQESIFLPYTQAHAGISRHYGGTGLGLAICRRLVDAMGGQLNLESKVGVGSSFFFALPLEANSGKTETLQEALPLKILVVDDNPMNQRVIAAHLQKDGHDIIAAGSAKAALQALAAQTVDAILMDMEMPDIDGPAATRMIRDLKDVVKAATPIIAMTANVMKEDIARCLQAGMNDYLGKPIDLQKLRTLLRQISFNPARLFDGAALEKLKGRLPPEQLAGMIEDLYDKAESLIHAAEKAAMEKNAKVLATSGHDLQGMTANFGLTALSAIAGKIHCRAKENAPPETLDALVRQLRPACDSTRKAVDAWMKA